MAIETDQDRYADLDARHRDAMTRATAAQNAVDNYEAALSDLRVGDADVTAIRALRAAASAALDEAREIRAQRDALSEGRRPGLEDG